MIVAPSGVADPGTQNHHVVTGRLDVDADGCRPGCLYSGDLQSIGDQLGVSVFGRHHLAERERAARAQRSRKPGIRVARLFDDLITRIDSIYTGLP